MREPTREGVPLDHVFVSREGLGGSGVVGGCPGHSSHVFGSSSSELGLQRANFDPLYKGSQKSP